MLAVSHHGADLREGFEYAIDGTPCSLIVTDDFVSIPEGTCTRFPKDEFTVRHALDSYVAVAMRGSAGNQIGYIGVQSRRRLDPNDDERAALSIFGARAAAEIERRRHEVALRARETEIAASRVRIVEAADEERRRIGRNLHDGAQQRLVALGHMLAMAGRRLAEEPEAAGALLDQAREQAVLAGDELRELVRGLHPAGPGRARARPRAGHSGHALAAAAAHRRGARAPAAGGDRGDRLLPRLRGDRPTRSSTPTPPRSASRCACSGQKLLVAVHDDGCGGAEASAGTGLAGLADRVTAVGGTLRVESPPGAGTRLEATIALAPWRTAREPFLEFGHGDDGGLGDSLLEMVLDGRKTVSVALAREWDLEGGLPRPGQRVPVLDASGTRRAIVEVVRVTVVPFGDVDSSVVEASQAGVATVPEWHAMQREFYEGCRDEVALLLAEPGWRLTDDEPMVVTWFTRVE